MYIIFLALLFAFLVIFLIKKIFGPKRLDIIQKLMDNGQYERAIQEALQVITKNERNNTAHWFLAECYHRLNQMDKALLEYKYLTKLNKYDALVKEIRVRNRLADIYLHYGQLEEAQKEFLLINRLNPTNFEVLYKIAKIFFDRGYSENALAYFSKALKQNPRHADSLFFTGKILFDAKKLSNAQEYLSQAIRIAPKMHKTNYYLGLIYKANNNFNQAIVSFEDATRDKETRHKARLMKGRCYFEMGDLTKAVIELEKAIKAITEEDNISLAIRYTLAASYERTRNLPLAIEQWETIAKMKPNYNDVLEKLSMYQDLRTDDHLKDFLTASNEKFETICKDITRGLGLDIVKFITSRGNFASIIATEPDSKWRNVRVTNKLIHIYRESHNIEEAVLRKMQEEMKLTNTNKAYILTVTKFSPSARKFAAARPIELIDKDGLAQVLKKAAELKKND